MRKAVKHIRSFAALTDDWDSYGACRITDTAICEAIAFLRRITTGWGDKAGERVRPFAVAPIPSGGVQLEWRSVLADVEVEVNPDGSYDYLVVDYRGGCRTFREKDRVTSQEVQAVLETEILAPEFPGAPA